MKGMWCRVSVIDARVIDDVERIQLDKLKA